jgi:hypothetical protein
MAMNLGSKASLGSNPGSTTSELCDLGQVASLPWASVSLLLKWAY